MKKPIKNMAKEALLVGISLTLMILIIIFTSIANAGFDITKLKSEEMYSSAIINATITIFGTIVAIPLGIASTKTRKNADGSNGRYIQDYKNYNIECDKTIANRIAFSQWHENEYLNEVRQKKLNYLHNAGILQAELILQLDRAQILELYNAQYYEINGERHFFKSLTLDQISKCLKVYDGKVNVKKLSDYYWLYIDGKSNKSFYDQAHDEHRVENVNIIGQTIYRVLLGFLITCVFTGLVYDFIKYDELTAQIIASICINTLARIFNAILSVFWGYLIGQEHVYILCYYINGKTQFLAKFNNDTKFKSKNIEDIAKEEYIERRKKEDSQFLLTNKEE